MHSKRDLRVAIYILTIVFLSPTNIFSQGDLKSQVYSLIDKADEQIQINDDNKVADSLNHLAIDMAESSLNDELLYSAVLSYLTREEFGNKSQIEERYLQKAIDLSNQSLPANKRFELWVSIAEGLVTNRRNDEAESYSRRALSYAASIDDSESKLKAYIANSKVNLKNNRVQEAYQNLLNAENIVISGDDILNNKYGKKVYQALFKFHMEIRNYDKAFNLKRDRILKLEQKQSLDSAEYFRELFDLCDVIIISGKNIDIEDKIISIIEYAVKNDDKVLHHIARSMHKSYLINNLELKTYYKLYRKDFENQEFKDSLKRADYCLNNAFFCEANDRIDSANLFYLNAINMAEAGSNPVRKANFHRRYAQFLKRHDQLKEAYYHFIEALDLAKKAGYDTYIIEITKELDDLAVVFGDYEAAYAFSALHSEKTNLLAAQQRKDFIIQMDLQNQARQNERLLEKKYEEKKKKRNLQYFAIAVGLIVLFLVFIIVSSMTVSKWLIHMLGFFSILFIFEFIILIMDHEIHEWAHGNTIVIFLTKIAILSVLYPLHHVIEKGVSSYMISNQLISRPEKSSIRKFLYKLYPWMNQDHDGSSGH